MDNGNMKLNREVVFNELSHRRTKIWNIFSWSSGILIAITGGVIALKTGNPPAELSKLSNIILTLAVAVLCTCAYLWIKQNMVIERNAEELLNDLDKELELKMPRGPFYFGYTPALIVLTLAAFAAIWGDKIFARLTGR